MSSVFFYNQWAISDLEAIFGFTSQQEYAKACLLYTSGGLDDLRPFCRFSEIPVYSDAYIDARLDTILTAGVDKVADNVSFAITPFYSFQAVWVAS